MPPQITSLLTNGVFTVEPHLVPALGLPPPLIAEDFDYRTPRDLKSGLVPADTIDAQVQYALVVVRGTGAAALDHGQQFGKVRKLSDEAGVLIKQEARTALARLVRNGDIRITRLDVLEGHDWAEVQIDYVNLRARGDQRRSYKARVN